MLAVQKCLSDMSGVCNGDITKVLEKLRERYGIKYKLYDDNSVVLNYDLLHNNYPDSDIVRECRGLHLSTDDWSVKSRAFNRFLNYGERDTANIEFDSDTIVFDKIDGSLVILYYDWNTNTWQVRTRGTAFAEAPVFSIHGDVQSNLESNPITFRQLILSAIGTNDLSHLNSSPLNKGLSYVFELVSPENRIVTIYNERVLYFISFFVNETGEECNDYEFCYSYVNQFVKCKKIPYFKFSNINDIIKMSKELPPLNEGYVVRTGSNKRVKVKNPAYVALHLLHNNGQITDKRILELIEIGEDSEFLSYFPSEKSKFDSIKEKRRQLFSNVLNVYCEMKDVQEQKEFALVANKYPFSSILFKLRQSSNNRGSDEESLEKIWRQCSLSFKEKMLLQQGDC